MCTCDLVLFLILHCVKSNQALEDTNTSAFGFSTYITTKIFYHRHRSPYSIEKCLYQVEDGIRVKLFFLDALPFLLPKRQYLLISISTYETFKGPFNYTQFITSKAIIKLYFNSSCLFSRDFVKLALPTKLDRQPYKLNYFLEMKSAIILFKTRQALFHPCNKSFL